MLRNSSVTVKTIHFSEEQHNRVRLARRKRHCITKRIMASRGPQMWQQKEFPNCLYDTVASFAPLWDNTVHCSISHSAVTHHIPVLRPDKWKGSAGQLRLKCSSLSPAVTLQPVRGPKQSYWVGSLSRGMRYMYQAVLIHWLRVGNNNEIVIRLTQIILATI